MSRARQKPTPFNPSKRAMAKVVDPLPPPRFCQHCGSPVEIVSHTSVYGQSYSSWPWLYRCTDQMEGVDCDARVGMHPFTNIPLGSLANAPTRRARMEAKKLFEPLWKAHGAAMTRTEAYAWLAEAMGLPPEDAHFGLFTVEQCERFAGIMREGGPALLRPIR